MRRERSPSGEAIDGEGRRRAHPDWLREKRETDNKAQSAAQPEPNCPDAGVGAEEKKSFVQIKNAHALWLSRKRAEERLALKRITAEKQLKKINEAIRQRSAKERYAQWLIGAQSKPKPVPFGQGLHSNHFSLIFVCLRSAFNCGLRLFQRTNSAFDCLSGLRSCTYKFNNRPEWMAA